MRGLFVAVLVINVVLSAWFWQDYKYRHIVSLVRSAGGTVTTASDGKYIELLDNPNRHNKYIFTRLRYWFAGRWYTVFHGDINSVGLHNEVSAELLAVVGDITSLQQLSLSGSSVSNEDLRIVSHLRNLRNFNLENTSVSDSGLCIIALMHSLEVVRLKGTDVTDVGLMELTKLPRLVSITIDYPSDDERITAAGLKRLLKARPELEINGAHMRFPD